MTASKKEDFKISGPFPLSAVDWSCPEHRRIVAASLVQGAYILERDRQEKREGSSALAAAWWESFHFKLIDKLVDKADSSIFGVIYEIAPPARIALQEDDAVTFLNTSGNAPKFVIAFRGTIPKKKSITRDAKLDLRIVQHGLHRTSRFENAMKSAWNLVADAGHENVWIAGHSLGAAIATLAGKNMARVGINVTTFLFNPPFFAAPIERIRSERFKEWIRIANSYITAGITMAMKAQRHRVAESFTMVSSWVPHVYVNPSDHICSAYIGYFELRKKMEKIGAGNVGRLATQSSLRDLLLSAFGGDSNPQHLLPSAILTVNLSPAKSFLRAHGIHQWWNPDQDLRSQEYLYCLGADDVKEEKTGAIDTSSDETR